MIRSKSWLISAWNPNCSAILFCGELFNDVCGELRVRENDLRVVMRVVKKRKGREGRKLVQRGGLKRGAVFKYMVFDLVLEASTLCHIRFDAYRAKNRRDAAKRPQNLLA